MNLGKSGDLPGRAALVLALLLITIIGCSKDEPDAPAAPTPNAAKHSPSNSEAASPPAAAAPSQPEEQTAAMVIRITAGEHVVTYRLNDSIAARNLYAQLPLSLQVENYGSNEKIFYPPQPLDIRDAPQASGGLGVLAYYSPWADVVLFFDDFSPNGSLYELGHVVSGSEHIQSMQEGTITIEAVP